MGGPPKHLHMQIFGGGKRLAGPAITNKFGCASCFGFRVFVLLGPAAACVAAKILVSLPKVHHLVRNPNIALVITVCMALIVLRHPMRVCAYW